MARFLYPNIRKYLATQIRMSSDQVDIVLLMFLLLYVHLLKAFEISCLFLFHFHRRKEQEQLAALRKHHQDEIEHHKKEIERLQHEISRHQGKIKKLKHDD
ncbi:ATPase inhibitor [Triplophysa rosa]|uniref:ATPase inhibitor n=1 Tax=Triplophysa rosa TaxID=992332 RepID=A0A9W7WJQ6_TRIRA|nr:ATPase inhibitor [Triplophysa rosa]